MKQKLFALALLMLAAVILRPTQLRAQNPDDTKNAIANILAIGQATKAAKLQRQNAALKKIKEAFDGLKNGGSAADALTNSMAAIEAYPKFSTPYLLAAYASLQLDNPLNAHRFLVLYDRVAHKPENREINKDVPAEFVSQIREQTNSQFYKFTKADIERLSAHDGWIDQSVDLDIDPAFRGIIAGTDFGGDVPSEFDVEAHVGASYHKYFWFNKGKAFSTFGTKNFGIDLNGGFDFKTAIGNSGYQPSREQVYIQPGVFLGRWYIAPFKIQFNKLNRYSSAAPSFAYSYTQPGDKFLTRTSYDPQSNPIFLPLTEIRYYTNYISGYAHDYKKNPKPLATGYDASYIYVKWGDEVYNGLEPARNLVLEGEQAEGILGFQFSTGGKVSAGLYMGYGSLTTKKFSYNSTTKIYTTDNILDDTFFKSGINVRIRIY